MNLMADGRRMTGDGIYMLAIMVVYSDMWEEVVDR